MIGVAAGSSHTLMLTDQGVVLGVGSGGNGELGTGDRLDRADPTIMAVPGQQIVRVSAGAKFSVVCSAVGKIFSCGLNANGQLGLGHRRPALKPTQLRIFGCNDPGHRDEEDDEEDDSGSTSAIAAGGSQEASGPALGAARAKAKASRAKDARAVEVAVGLSHTLVLTAGGIVYAFGSMMNGRLGLGREAYIDATADPTTHMTVNVKVADVLVPTVVPIVLNGAKRRVRQVAAGGAHSMALLEDNGDRQGRMVVAWGANGAGQLGVGDDEDRLAATPVSIKWRDVDDSVVEGSSDGGGGGGAGDGSGSGNLDGGGSGHDDSNGFRGKWSITNVFCGGRHSGIVVERSAIKSVTKRVRPTPPAPPSPPSPKHNHSDSSKQDNGSEALAKCSQCGQPYDLGPRL